MTTKTINLVVNVRVNRNFYQKYKPENTGNIRESLITEYFHKYTHNKEFYCWN